MAQVPLEIVVRDLQRTIQDMVQKIGSMESAIRDNTVTISKQGEKISTQVDIITQLKSLVEGRRATPPAAGEVTTMTPPAALQRAARQAKQKATANIRTTGNYSAATKKSSAISADKPVVESHVTTKTPEVSRIEPKKTTATNELTARTHERENSAAAAPPLTPTQKKEGEKNDNWQQVTRKRVSRNTRRIITGSGKEDETLQAVEKRKHIQAWSFKPDTTVDCINYHVKKIIKCDDYSVVKREIKTDLHAAFVISVPESQYDKLCDASVWPPRVKLADWWFPRKPRGERGEQAAERISRAGPPRRAQV